MTAKTYPSRIECPSDVCGHQEAILREGLYYQCLNKPDPDTGARPHGHWTPPVAFVSGRCAGVLTGRSVFTRYCGKNARHEEGDRWYCGLHSPKLQEQRSQERETVRREKSRLSGLLVTREFEVKKARSAIVDAAIRWANNPAEDGLTSALRMAVEDLARVRRPG